ncbi:MAG: MogA/MoaB family molybdenum cofactor biosynthesis protein [Deltaproteobacteria bacterium]|jgi:molybdenum cofactor synthesis domain-containing protein|nr:MogA/MoaB family molybdenum cofactor biosynthesis protein [Deltaproteobacteria bacterium]MBW2143336.1 MogA/MoaB family molybdenum cofactor biosynthesis protein [Deltaproteobacteria bacterium]
MDSGFKTGVLTISDKGSQGLREDESGEIVAAMLEAQGFPVLSREIIPDDRQQVVDTLIKWVDRNGLSLIITSGGTGLSPTDVTPQAMEEVIDFQVPGMAEAMRAASLKKTPHAMISRAMAGVRKTCLIINVPGSPKGAGENLSVVLPALNHALSKLAGDTSDCAVQGS